MARPNELPPIPSLTGLRFIAALSVVVAHAMTKIVPVGLPWPQPYTYLAALSALGMPLFFTLSGFVIHYNYSQSVQHDGAKGLYNFFGARFARLYPLYALCIAFDLLLKFAYYQFPAHGLRALPFYATMTQSWLYKVISGHALIYQYGVVPSVAWSVSTEWFFYIAYPLICVIVLRMGSLKAVVGAAGAIFIALVAAAVLAQIHTLGINGFAIARYGAVADIITNDQDSFYRWLIYFSPYAQLPGFVLGCLAARAFQIRRTTAVTPGEERIGAYMTAGSVILTLAFFLLIYDPKSGILVGMLLWLQPNGLIAALVGPIAVLLFCCARYSNAIVRALASPVLVACGEASYSLYLLHSLVIDAFRWEAAPANDLRILVGDALRLGLTLLSAIGLSFVSYRTIEVPARRWILRLLGAHRSRRTPGDSVQTALPGLRQAPG